MDYIDGLVSVIIPAYNVASYITETIQTVQNQTYQNFEILIIDDCSKDDTGVVVQALSQEDARIKYICQPTNMGAAEARNRGLKEAKGRYIAFLDSDDLWDRQKLEKQLKDMADNDIAFSFTSHDYIDDNAEKTKDSIKIVRKVSRKILMTQTVIATSAVVIDRKKTGDVLMPLRRTGQDYAFWMLLLRNHDAYGLDEPLMHLRRRVGSLSRNKLQNIKDVWEVQTKNENVNRVSAMFNVARYCLYALKKRFM